MINDQVFKVPVSAANSSAATTVQVRLGLVPLNLLNWPTESGVPNPAVVQLGELYRVLKVPV